MCCIFSIAFFLRMIQFSEKIGLGGLLLLIFFFNIYLRCFKISSEGAGYRYSIEYKITFISSVSVHCSFFSLQASFGHIRLFQGPKVANCTRHRNIYTRWAPDICTYVHTILCEGDKVRESSFNRQLQGFKIMSSTNFSPFDTHAH